MSATLMVVIVSMRATGSGATACARIVTAAPDPRPGWLARAVRLVVR